MVLNWRLGWSYKGLILVSRNIYHPLITTFSQKWFYFFPFHFGSRFKVSTKSSTTHSSCIRLARFETISTLELWSTRLNTDSVLTCLESSNLTNFLEKKKKEDSFDSNQVSVFDPNNPSYVVNPSSSSSSTNSPFFIGYCCYYGDWKFFLIGNDTKIYW